MTRPLLLDLFCGEGGAAMGYHRAGFDVIGVDIEPQPLYPFHFIQGPFDQVWQMLIDDGMPWNFAVIHASPPCQHFTAYGRAVKDIKTRYEDVLPATRELLRSTGLPYIIENVPGAPLRDPIMLCGSSFGLDVRRHRLFESNMPLMGPPCQHGIWRERKYAPASNRTNGRFTCEIGVYRIPLETQKRAMGVEHDVTLRGLSEAIPPAYTEFIGRQLLDQLAMEAA